MNIHIEERDIWLTRHGESSYNLCSRIGGDSGLTEEGRRYSIALAKFIEQHLETPEWSHLSHSRLDSSFGGDVKNPRLSIWTSTLRRTIETVEFFNPDLYTIRHVKFLNEIYAGVCENMTYVSEISSIFIFLYYDIYAKNP